MLRRISAQPFGGISEETQSWLSALCWKYWQFGVVFRNTPISFHLSTAKFGEQLLKGFPYSVYYSLDNRAISVIAVLHQRRANTLWLDRSNGRN